MKYYLTELHAHTKHSDGDFTTHELLDAALAFGYDAIVITDHNTTAPLEEAKTWDSNELVILSGMEWTTFFGHLLVIGARKVVDWRKATIETIDSSLEEIKAAGGLTGIAHPFSIGSPICTGCHWDFHVQDYSLIDFIEVWNRLNPDEDFRSQQAYEMWVDLLNQGFRISCSAGRDWHRQEDETDSTALTYVGANVGHADALLANLKKGNYYITLGPRIHLSMKQAGKTYVMGDELRVGDSTLKITLEPTEQAKLKAFNFVGEYLVVWQNDQIIACETIEEGIEKELSLELVPGYLRIEIFGRGKGHSNKRLVISNPFYIGKA